MKSESKIVATAELDSDSESESESELKVVAKAELDSDSESESESESKVVAKAELDSDSESESESKVVAKAELDSDSESEFQSKLLLVEETHIDSNEKYLFMCPSLLKKLVPDILKNSYSHWLNISTNIIDFRPRNFDDENFRTDIYYQLNISNGLLRDVKRGSKLVEINSFSFNKLKLIFNRLEFPQFMHMYCRNENKSTQVIVDLPRFGLQFEVTPKGIIQSIQYSHMCVSADQKRFGVLIGLEFGLLLEPIDSFTDVMSCALLIPHCRIKGIACDGHHKVRNDDSQSFFLFRKISSVLADISNMRWTLVCSSSECLPERQRRCFSQCCTRRPPRRFPNRSQASRALRRRCAFCSRRTAGDATRSCVITVITSAHSRDCLLKFSMVAYVDESSLFWRNFQRPFARYALTAAFDSCVRSCHLMQQKSIKERGSVYRCSIAQRLSTRRRHKLRSTFYPPKFLLSL